jgi:tRNA G18 (ribose-2'-O)-methylase SpoU
MGIDFLLYNVQSPINVGQILRTADVYGMTVYCCDGAGIFDDADKRRVVADFACGAFERTPPILVPPEALPALLAAGRRNIATTVDGRGRELQRFAFHEGDLVILGNEYRGIDDGVTARCQARLTIPMLPGERPKPRSWSPIAPEACAVATDGVPCLNVGAAAAIIAYQSYLVEPARPSAFADEDTRRIRRAG